MKFISDFADVFMSPQNGSIPLFIMPDLEEGYTYLGDRNNKPFASPILIDLRLEIIDILTTLSQTKFILQTAKQGFGSSQALDQLGNGFLVTTKGVLSIGTPGSGTIALPKGMVFVGDDNNLASAQQTITNDNLPNLSFEAIWRGDINGRPEESQSLTLLEGQVTTLEDVTIPALEAEIAALQGAVTIIEAEIFAIQAQLAILEGEVIGLIASVAALQAQVIGLIASVASLSSRVSTLEGDVSDLQTRVTAIENEIIALNNRIDNLRLNTIPADGDVSFYNFKLINLANPVNPTDGVNLRTMQAAISGAVGNITLDGFVEGHSDANGVIHTTRGADCLLTNIPAGGDVDMECHRIKNLSPCVQERGDAISAQFLWDLMHDEVKVIWA